jgi:hypothetical protein
MKIGGGPPKYIRLPHPLYHPFKKQLFSLFALKQTNIINTHPSPISGYPEHQAFFNKTLCSIFSFFFGYPLMGGDSIRSFKC